MHDPGLSDERVARCTGVVLAGGRGARMGGRDKGLVAWQGKPLAAHVLEQLAPQVEALMISANRNLEAYAALGAVVVRDAQAGFPGPLAGMLAALRASTSGELAYVPCDSPRIPADLVARLRDACARAGAMAAYARTPAGMLYTHVLLQRRCETTLAGALASSERSVRGLLERVGAVAVDFDDWGAPLNLNSL